MTLGISASHPAFRQAVADVDAAADRLRADRDHVSRQVDTLLDGGWSGVAASAYAEGWATWRAGADQVLDALAVMGRLLDTVDTRFATSDRDAQGSLDRLAARLG